MALSALNKSVDIKYTEAEKYKATKNLKKGMSNMNRELIFIGSITRTMRARDILKVSGITAKIERQSGDLTNEGCGYGVIVVDGETERAKDILLEHGYNVRRNE